MEAYTLMVFQGHKVPIVSDMWLYRKDIAKSYLMTVKLYRMRIEKQNGS